MAGSALADAYDDAAATCGKAAVELPFAAWGDTDGYFMLPNGSFEAGAADWGLTGGATTVDEPEPPWVDADGDATALQIPRGSAATSSPVCIDSATPAMRFFTRSNGASGARLRVDAIFKSSNGKPATLPVATIGAGSRWAPTEQLRLNLIAIGAVSKSSPTGVAFRFTAVNGSWKIDRIYVDPLKECC